MNTLIDYVKTRGGAALAVGLVGFALIEGVFNTLMDGPELAATARVFLLVLLVVILVPALSNLLTGRGHVRRLPKEARADMEKHELRAFAALNRPRRWAEAAGVSLTVQKRRTVMDKDGRTHNRTEPVVRMPRVIGAKLTPTGPGLEFETVRGGPIPSDWDAPRVGAALGFTVTCEELTPNRVFVSAVTRDPLSAATTAPVGDGWQVLASTIEGDWGDDWGLIDGEAEDNGGVDR